MTRRRFLALSCCLLSLIGFSVENRADSIFEQHLSLGVRSMTYEESSQGREVSHESGTLDSFSGRIDMAMLPRLRLMLGLDADQGDVRYQGQTQSGSVLNTTSGQTFVSLYGALLYRMPLQQDYFDVSLGAGNDMWRRSIEGNGSTPALDEFYHWNHFRLASQYGLMIGPALVRFHGAVSYLSNASVEVDLSDWGYESPVIPMKNTLQYDAGISTRLWHSDIHGLWLDYRWNYRHFPASESISVTNGYSTLQIHEPENTFQSQYLMLRWTLGH